MLQCVAVCCTVLHCVAVWVALASSSTLSKKERDIQGGREGRRARMGEQEKERESERETYTLCCSICHVRLHTLQHTATHCNRERERKRDIHFVLQHMSCEATVSRID